MFVNILWSVFILPFPLEKIKSFDYNIPYGQQRRILERRQKRAVENYAGDKL